MNLSVYKIALDIITVNRYNIDIVICTGVRDLLNDLLEQKQISKYLLSKVTGIPYSTLSDICSGKTSIARCSAETVYKLAKFFNVTMESLIDSEVCKRVDFDNFKSNVCHALKESGDIDFINSTIEKDDIRKMYRRKWYPESFYLLAMVDYLSRINDVPLCSEYDDLRRCRLSETVYPSGILAEATVMKDDSVKERAKMESIPEFMRYNIVECDIRNVV